MKKLNILTFFVILTFFLLVSAHGIFESGIFRDAVMKIATWKVEINGSVVTNEQKTFSIDDITWNSSDNVLEGKVAPGIDGYFDIIIDPNDTDVSVRYDLIYDMSTLKSINEAFVITKVEEINGKKLTLTDKDTYTGIIDLKSTEAKEIYTIRTYIKWEDIETNNDNDYLLGTSSITFELPIEVNVTQYLGEEIVEYVDSED